MLNRFLVVGAFVALPFAVSAASNKAQQGPYVKQDHPVSLQEYKLQGDSFRRAGDERILNDIRARLSKDGVTKNGDRIEVVISSGNVTVRGQVDNEKEKDRIVAQIQKVDGVKRIRTAIHLTNSLAKRNMTIIPAAAHNNPDHTLREKVESALKSGWFSKKHEHVLIHVKDGVVNVSGKVSNDKEKQEVEKRISGIAGVKKVNNRLELEPTVYTPKAKK